jgi:hypothetical protein
MLSLFFKPEGRVLKPFVSILFALLTSTSILRAQYFPKLSLADWAKEDAFRQEWYSSQLRALKEPSLLPKTKPLSSETYRFLWLRSFRHPVSVRIEIKADGTGILTTKVTSGAGGYRPGVLIQNSSRPLSQAETHNFTEKVKSLNFWQIQNLPHDGREGDDGAQWILEGVKDGKYHVIDRWSPKDGPVHELACILLFNLARLNFPKNEIY